MATIKELLSTIIDKINDNEDKIDNIKGVPEAFDSITMTNGTDMANLTMSAEKELLFNGEAVGGSGGDLIEQKYDLDFPEMEFTPKSYTYAPKPAFDLAGQYTESGVLLKDAFVDGETYIVTFDGIEHECVAYTNGNGIVCLGNGSFGIDSSVYENTGEPFLFSPYFEMYLIHAENTNPHTVSVRSVDYEEVIKEEYLPFENGIIKQSALPEGYAYDNRVGIFWDGNTEGLTKVTSGWNFYLYGPFENKWGLTVQDLIGVAIKHPASQQKYTITEEHISEDGKSIYVTDGGYGIFCFVEEGATYELYGETLAEGIWLCKYSNDNNQLFISGEIKMFDEEFIGKPIKVLNSFPSDVTELESGLYWSTVQETMLNGTYIYLKGLIQVELNTSNDYLVIINLANGYVNSFYFDSDSSEWVSEYEGMHYHSANHVPDASGETVTASEFNALLTSLREAGFLWSE